MTRVTKADCGGGGCAGRLYVSATGQGRIYRAYPWEVRSQTPIAGIFDPCVDSMAGSMTGLDHRPRPGQRLGRLTNNSVICTQCCVWCKAAMKYKPKWVFHVEALSERSSRVRVGLQGATSFHHPWQQDSVTYALCSSFRTNNRPTDVMSRGT